MTKTTTALPEALERGVEAIRASGLLAEDWYRDRYPDVALAGMDPALHYLKYGARLGRDPGPDFNTRFYLDTHPHAGRREENPLVHRQRALQKTGAPPEPDRKSVLWAASRLVERDPTRALAFAEALLPPDLAYTTEILRANAALGQGDEAGWLAHLNSYLRQFGAAPVRLKPTGATCFHRLGCDSLPPVKCGPRVSVIMPAWNAEATIATAARSVLDQTWRPLELIIVDDASTDGTWGEMRALAVADDRVKILRNRRNVGPYVSKNLALRHATGEYITGHDADDWAHPQRLEKHLKEVLPQKESIKFSLTLMMRMQTNSRLVVRKIGDFCWDGIAQRASISCMFNTAEFRRHLGSWECARFGADSELIKRAEIAFACPAVHFREIGMICLDLSTSLTNNPFSGIDKIDGMSLPRKEYRSYWKARHAMMSQAGAYLSFPLSAESAMNVPADARVPEEDLMEVINESGWS